MQLPIRKSILIPLSYLVQSALGTLELLWFQEGGALLSLKAMLFMLYVSFHSCEPRYSMDKSPKAL